jgi:hypothetical protein
MPGELQKPPPTRAALTRAIAVNAATKPVNIVVPAAIAVVGALLGVGWLWPLAVVVYIALVAVTFFDADEAEAVGQRRRGGDETKPAQRALDPATLAPPIAERLQQALAEERQIRTTIEGADVELTEISGEVDGLVGNLEKSAQRAQLVYGYLAEQDSRTLDRRARELARHQDPDSQRAAAAVRDQMKLAQDLEATLNRFYAQMDHAVVSLQTIRGELVRISVAGEAEAQAETADRVRNLREEVGAMADGMREAYARADSV